MKLVTFFYWFPFRFKKTKTCSNDNKLTPITSAVNTSRVVVMSGRSGLIVGGVVRRWCSQRAARWSGPRRRSWLRRRIFFWIWMQNKPCLRTNGSKCNEDHLVDVLGWGEALIGIPYSFMLFSPQIDHSSRQAWRFWNRTERYPNQNELLQQ